MFSSFGKHSKVWCGGHFVASSSWLVWGGLFHRFGRCPNHGHFLEEFIFKSAPKLVLVTGACLALPLFIKTIVVTVFSAHFIANSHFEDSKLLLSLRSYSVFWLWEAFQNNKFSLSLRPCIVFWLWEALQR